MVFGRKSKEEKKADEEKKKAEQPDLWDIDLDVKKLYGEHVWIKDKGIRKLYKPLWSMFSKDYQQYEFITMPKAERVRLIKERAASTQKGQFYETLPLISEVVGRDKEINTFLSSIYYHILKDPNAMKLDMAPPKVFLVKGEPGSGKSFLIKAVMREAFDRALEEGFILDLFPLEGASVTGMFMGQLSGGVRGAFDTAQKKPTFLFIDEAQQLTRKGSEYGGGDSAGKEHEMAESAILTALDNIMSSPVRTIVVLGSNNSENIREDIRRRCAMMDLDAKTLSHDSMVEIVRKKLLKLNLDLDAEKVLDTLEQALRGLGQARMVPHDITRAFDAVARESQAPVIESFLSKTTATTERIPITYDSFKKIAPEVRAYKEQQLTQAAQDSEQTVPPKTRYADVGGLKGIKDEIIKEVTLSLNPLLGGDKWVPPKGYLWYGPPGCGKTLMAQAIAGENKVPVYVINAASLMSGLVGESEKSLRQVFARARQHAPSIIFMDEIDSIGRKRGSVIGGNAGVAESMLTTLMTQLQGFNPMGRVVFIGATNRPDVLDAALLERLDKQYEFPYPKSTDEKLDVIKAQWREFSADSAVTPEQILRLFISKSFSPRVCADVIKEAARYAQMESIACHQMFEALSLDDPTKMDEKKIKMLKTVFAQEFERIRIRELPPDAEGLTLETSLIAVYEKIAAANPINFEHIRAAFERKAVTEQDRAIQRYSEMHRTHVPTVGKGYGLGADQATGTKGVFMTVECKMFKAAGRHKGNEGINCWGNFGKGATESAYIGRDLIRQYAPSIMDYDIDIHIVSLAEGTEEVAVSGPSAGQIMLFCMISAFLDEPINPEVCMTGKVDFNGIVGIVGGIQPGSGAGKLDAARENKFKYVLIPMIAFSELQKNWMDYLTASFESGTQIVGGRDWLDYAVVVFDQPFDVEKSLRQKQ
jgi:SpoVK/Ycf46/Vps4 family AAA+-type ATPase